MSPVGFQGISKLKVLLHTAASVLRTFLIPSMKGASCMWCVFYTLQGNFPHPALARPKEFGVNLKKQQIQPIAFRLVSFHPKYLKAS